MLDIPPSVGHTLPVINHFWLAFAEFGGFASIHEGLLYSIIYSHLKGVTVKLIFMFVSMVVYDIQQTAAAATASTDDVDALLSGLQELSLQSGADPKETFHKAMASVSMAPTKERVRFVAHCTMYKGLRRYTVHG